MPSTWQLRPQHAQGGATAGAAADYDAHLLHPKVGHGETRTHTRTHLQITSRSCRPAALLDAARTGNTDEVLALLRRPTDPVDVNGASDDGSTALIVAAEKGHPATVAALAEAGAAVNAGAGMDAPPLRRRQQPCRVRAGARPGGRDR